MWSFFIQYLNLYPVFLQQTISADTAWHQNIIIFFRFFLLVWYPECQSFKSKHCICLYLCDSDELVIVYLEWLVYQLSRLWKDMSLKFYYKKSPRNNKKGRITRWYFILDIEAWQSKTNKHWNSSFGLCTLFTFTYSFFYFCSLLLNSFLQLLIFCACWHFFNNLLIKSWKLRYMWCKHNR